MSIIFEPIGGLGNQLFTYFLAKELQTKVDVPIYFRLRNYDLRSTPQYELDSFEDGKNLQIIEKIPYGFIYDSSFFNFFINNFPILRRLNYPKIYYEKNTKFSPEIFHFAGNFVARGYFQSWKYFETSIDKNKSKIFNLTNESNWYKNMKKELEARGNFTAIHMRGGDYKRSPSHGILRSVYYERALYLLRKMESLYACPIIFSNDSELFKEYEFIDKQNTSLILAPTDSRPIESLLLMSMADSIIIANSTFSWWSAFLSEASVVIAPRPWLADNHHNDRDLIPPTWLTIGR